MHCLYNPRSESQTTRSHRPRMYAIHPSSLLCIVTDKLSGTDVDPCVWSMVEVCVAIVCACLPTFKVLFNRLIRPKRVSTSTAYIVDMPRYPALTTDEHRSDYRSKESESQVAIVKRVHDNWVQVRAPG